MKTHIFKYIILTLVVNLTLLLNGYTQEIPVERIHIHLQKNTYIAGEAIHFKVYCLNAKTQKLSNISKVAYAELIGENGFPVAQTNITLNKGLGEGGFVISKQLPTGNYAINTYTHWMKTSSPDFISVSPLFVFNNQKIGVNAPDALAVPEGFYRDLKNNELTLLKSEGKLEKISINTKIEDANRILRISVKNNDNNTYESFKFQILSKEGKVLDKNFQFNQQNWEIRLKIKDLKSSNYNICIRDKQDQILKTAVVHIDKSRKGRFIEKPPLSTGKRKKNAIKLHMDDISQQDDSLFLSASIKLKEPNNTVVNIIDYINLYSDFGANMLPYFKKIKQLDKQSWIAEDGPETLWLKNSNSYSINANRYPEEEAYILEGTVKNRISNKALANENVYLSKIGAYADISTFRTNDKGQFFFNLPLSKGLHDISIQVRDKDDLDLAVALKDKFSSEGFAPTPWCSKQLQGEQLSYLKQVFENYRIRDIYKKETYREIKDTCLYRGKSSFYGKAQHSITIDNYIQLDSLEEYFHEFISTIKIKYKKNKPYMYIFSPDANRTFNKSPLILYDGLILSDASPILNKPSTEIDRIEVVPYEYYYGSSHLYGIVNVISKKQDCELNELPKNTERYYLPLFTNSVEYVKFGKHLKNNLADYRTDLLWEPYITLSHNKDFELVFTTSDIKGEYELIIQGISESGDPIVIKQSILVE